MSYDLTQVNEAYDNLTSKIKTDLDNQYQLGRLTGSDYANVYAQLIGQCLQLAFQAPIDDKQISKLDADINMIQKQEDKINEDINLTRKQEDNLDKDLLVKDQQIASSKAQEAVYERQKQGFDDKLKMDLTKMQLDTWGMMFSSGLLSDKPSIISNDSVSSMYSNLEATALSGSTIPAPIVTYDTISNVPKNTGGFKGVIDNYDSDSYDYTIETVYSKLGITNNNDGTFTYSTPDTTDSDIVRITAKDKSSDIRRVIHTSINWQ